MIVVRYCVSNPQRHELRAKYLDAHKQWLANLPMDILLSGPAVQVSSGGGVALIVASAPTIADLSELSESDPFVQHGVYSEVTFIEWTPTRGRLLPDLPR